jgi:hypothetical protein
MLLMLTHRRSKAEKDTAPLLVSAAQIAAVERHSPQKAEAGATVVLASGKSYHVTETVEQVYELALKSGPFSPMAEEWLGGKASRATERAIAEAVPTDRPDTLHPRPHEAAVAGEPHPAAHAAEATRREKGDPLADLGEGVERKEGAPSPGDPLPGHLGRQPTMGIDADKLTKEAQAKQPGGGAAKAEEEKPDAKEAQEAATSGKFGGTHPSEAREGSSRQQDQGGGKEPPKTPAAITPPPQTPKRGGTGK